MTDNKDRRIIQTATGAVIVEQAHWCATFFSKLRGFTFRRQLAPGEGLVLVYDADSRVNSGITMLFCFMDLGVIWVNDAGEVVDTTLAKPWRVSYLPEQPARYVIEAEPGVLGRIRIGDRLQFVIATRSDPGIDEPAAG